MARAAESEAARVRAGVVSPRELAYRRHEARPVEEHLVEWHTAILAKGKSVKHADHCLERARVLVALVAGAELADVEPGRSPAARAKVLAARQALLKPVRLTHIETSKVQEALATLRDAGRSLQTCNHYRDALRAFCRWAKGDKRLRENPMEGVSGYNAEEDPRHPRRALSDGELAELVRVASGGPAVFGMSEPLRAMAYRLAASTGFRAEEIRRLVPAHFELDGAQPRVRLKPIETKNRKGAEQPIPSALVPDLRAWLEGVPEGAPAFPLHHETAKAIRADLEAADVPYETAAGFADFHSLRAYYIGALERSGASVKTVQTLARHSNPALTLKRYAKPKLVDLRGAVEEIPQAPAAPREGQEGAALSATGTDPAPINEDFATLLPLGQDGAGRTLPGLVAVGQTEGRAAASEGSPQGVGRGGEGRGRSDTVGIRAERTGRLLNFLSRASGDGKPRFDIGWKSVNLRLVRSLS
jgi:integrase